MKRNRLISLFLIYAIWCGSFATPAQNQILPNASPPTDRQAESKGLQFRLREAAAPEKGEIKETPVTNLSETQAEAIFRRLPPMETETAAESNFALRPNSLPPPKTGNIISANFPAAEQIAAPDVSAVNPARLEIARFSPDGAVPLVSDLSVTFSQPMRTVGAQTATDESAVVNLSPQVAGKWRWLGTKTLIFDAAGRFPMATKFTATVSAGTKSATGGILLKDFSWTFATAPPQVETFIPDGETVRRDAILLASFNQAINPNAVLAKTSARTIPRQIPLRLATAQEIAADEKISEAVKQLPANRWLAFRAADSLPADSPINITFEAGTPSAEGDLTTTAPQNFLFKTFGELKFEKSFCSYWENSSECPAYADLTFRFNNPLDVKSFDKSQIKIEPEIENAEISVEGNRVEIGGGFKKPRATYRVTVAKNLKDEFGQTLGADVSATFTISPLPAGLSAENRDGDFVVLDPHGAARFSVYSTNYPHLKIKLYAVAPEDYGKFDEFRRGNRAVPPSFGKIVFDKNVQIKSATDEQIETPVDLRPALRGGFGHAVLIVEPPAAVSPDERVVVWLAATRIGVDAFADYEKLIVFTSDLKTGAPLGKVNLETSNGARGTTGADGIADILLPAKNETRSDWLIARRGADAAILNGSRYYGDDEDWTRRAPPDGLRWFVFDDRKMYRPGETVSIKGYIRRVLGGKFADLAALAGAVGETNYLLKDARGNEGARGKASVNRFGAFDFQLKLPENFNLGTQSLKLTANGDFGEREFTHYFQAQEFRRPEFEVTAAIGSPAPFFVGDSATVSVEAKYFSGGFLRNAETNWTIEARPTNYTPPNRDDFTFGVFVAWWRDHYDGDYDERTSQQFKGSTGADGKHRLAIDLISANPARPFAVKAEARVQDVNRQAFADAIDLLVHPSEFYVGIRAAKNFVAVGETLRVETITTDVDGNAVPNADVSVVAELKDWQQIEGEWREVTIDAQSCRVKSAAAPATCDFAARQGGVFTIKASVLDERERRNESELTVWVAGANREPTREVERENVELIPNRKEYAPGDAAEILVNAPFFPAEGVLTLRRNGIVKTERFTMNESSIVLRVPIEEKYLPNVHIQVDLVGATKRIFYDDERDRRLPKRAAFAGGALDLKVSTASRNLSVTAQPISRTLEPGGATEINVAVKDHLGNAVSDSEIAVVAVDESILALTDYRIADPLGVFYQPIDAGVNDYHSRENILLGHPDGTKIGFGYGSGSGDGSGNGSAGNSILESPLLPVMTETAGKRRNDADENSPDRIRLRTNFNALAVFAPSVKTGADGRATVKINLPDNLTRYRVTAIAVTDAKQFGAGESAITARQSLQIRPSAPRFMNFGDRIELPVVVQNQTDAPLTVDLAMRATNASLIGGSGRRTTIAGGDRAEIRFPVNARNVGTARFQIGATAGRFADAAEFEFPVYTPATTEAFATYGTTDQNGAIVQPVALPSDVFPQFGGLEITTASTQLQELTDAFIYLQNYPFECSEQIASRMLATAALRDVLRAFDAKDLPSAAAIEAKMRADIERLRRLQHGDGGFSFWRKDDASVPYVSVHVAHALARATQKGYAMPTATSANAVAYLKNIEAKYPDYYSPEARRAISAYALYVRDLLGDKDAAKALEILQGAALENFSPETIGWLLSVLADDIDSTSQVEMLKRHLLNRATETAGAAHFVAEYADGEYVLLNSERRADAVILEAFLKVAPNDDLIPKIVRGLLANRTKGRWANTQENVFVLLALERYFQIYEKVAPNFTARIWLGQTFAGEQKFVGRSVDSNSINVPMNVLQQTQETSNLILDKRGDGRIYYRIGMKYAARNLNAAAADYGFTVSREYEAIDDAADVRRNADGNWTIKSGARIRVRVRMVAPTRRYHVALVDNLPAGLEIINTDLANAESLPGETNIKPPSFENRFNSRLWYEHQNLRDARTEAFTALLRAGVWDYSYLARATTVGNFVAPPAKAEEMYAPETFGRSGTDFIKVE